MVIWSRSSIILGQVYNGFIKDFSSIFSLSLYSYVRSLWGYNFVHRHCALHRANRKKKKKKKKKILWGCADTEADLNLCWRRLHNVLWVYVLTFRCKFIMPVHTHTHTHAHAHTHTYAYTCTHAHARTHTHTDSNALGLHALNIIYKTGYEAGILNGFKGQNLHENAIAYTKIYRSDNHCMRICTNTRVFDGKASGAYF